MNGNEHNKIYTAADIQNYLQGKLTPLQMNAIEKAALDDPFLAEAIEGYEGMQQQDWKKELAVLKEEFTQKQSGAKIIIFKKRTNNWMKAAAAVLVIGGTATLSYFLLNKKDKQEIAQNIIAKPAGTDTATAGNATVSNLSATATPNGLIKDADKQKSAAQVRVSSGAVSFPGEKIADSSVSNFVYTPDTKTQQKAEAKKSEEKTAEDLAIVTKPTLPPATANAAPANNNTVLYNNSNAAEGYYNKTANNGTVLADKAEQEKKYFAKELPLNKNFMAQVMAPDNSPLPFANISIKTESFGTYADVKGNFRLVSSDSVLTVEVKSLGYKPQYFTLKSNGQQNKIVLTEDDMAFKDRTVVSGNAGTVKAKLSRRATVIKDSVVNVEPADGWDNYNTYVDNNINIPDDILEKNIHGQVELSFEVNTNGTITNIKVDKSLCGNCDEAAKRLLQQGPQWKVKNGKKGKGKVTVQF
jgi:TonB family protein